MILQCERLGGGLQKIAEAREQIHELNQLLEVQKVAVLEKSAACEKLIKEIAIGGTRESNISGCWGVCTLANPRLSACGSVESCIENK